MRKGIPEGLLPLGEQEPLVLLSSLVTVTRILTQQGQDRRDQDFCGSNCVELRKARG